MVHRRNVKTVSVPPDILKCLALISRAVRKNIKPTALVSTVQATIEACGGDSKI